MPVKLGEREYRAIASPMVLVPQGERRFNTEHYAEGHFTTFGNFYTVNTPIGSFEERVMPGSLDEVDLSDVIFQFEHSGRVFARRSNGTLIVERDPIGGFFAADLSKSSEARNFHEEVRNGLVTGMSWGFRIAEDGDTWSRRSDGTLERSIHRFEKVFDVSGVARGANDAADISARSSLSGALELEKRESRAHVLKLKTQLLIGE